MDRVANPKDVSTKDKDDGSDIAAWDIAYPAAGGGMPVCEEEGEELVERCVGRKVVEVGELVSEKRGRGFLWRIRRGLGRA